MTHHPVLAYFGATGPWELMIVALVVLLLFGKRLPDVMRSLGRSVVEFKKGVQGIDHEEEQSASESEPSNTTQSS